MENNCNCLNKIEKNACNLIQGLQAIQSHEGFVSKQSIAAAAKYFSVPEAEVEDLLSFYSQFRRSKPARFRVAVCDGTACHVKGGPMVLDWISAELRLKSGETDEKGLFSLETSVCLGCCNLAPAMSINGKVFGKLDHKTTVKILKDHRNSKQEHQ